jgi:hypothetical protein
MVGDEFIRQTNDYDIQLKELAAKERHEKRRWWGLFFGWLLAAIVVVSIAGFLVWGWADSARAGTERTRQAEETVRACLTGGGSWVTLNGKDTCLHLEVRNG